MRARLIRIWRREPIWSVLQQRWSVGEAFSLLENGTIVHPSRLFATL